MKRFSKILALLLCGVFFACAGGNSTPKRPKHLTAGMEILSEGIDIRVTLHFVNRWIEGETLESLCR